MDLGIGPD